MALENPKKKQKQLAEIKQEKSASVNTALWTLSVLLILAVAVGNMLLAEQIALPIRVVAVVIGLLVALGVAAMTNQGEKARQFFSASRVELRRITWATRQETTQTTFIIMAVTVLVSVILWGFDSIIVSAINFLTELRF